MAKKPAKKPDGFNALIAKFCSQGDVMKAARAVADAGLSEANFDAIMAENPGLREAFYRL